MAEGDADEMDAAEECDHPTRGTCSVYKTADGASLPISQAEHYAHRCPALQALNFDEFVIGMRLEKMSAAKCEKVASEAGKAGRPTNVFYDLQSPHPLAGNYVIKTKSKLDVPIFVGAPPTTPACENGPASCTQCEKTT